MAENKGSQGKRGADLKKKACENQKNLIHMPFIVGSKRFSTFIVTGKNPFRIGCTDGIFAFLLMFSYSQCSK